MTEKHFIKVTAQIKHVKLLVRFPCKLTFQLKTDHAQHDSKIAYELKKGECAVNEILQAEAELNYDSLSGQYEDKKVRIYVHMASANGVIPAGNVTFNPCNKEPLERVEYTLPLQKCPDRSAQITFHQSFQLLRKKGPEVIYQSHVGSRQPPKISKLDLKYSTASQMVLQSQVQRKSPRDKSSNSRNPRPNYREASPHNPQRIKTSYNPPDYAEQYDEYGESQVQEEAMGYQKYNSRYIEPNEKAHYVKEIAKLKGELKSLQTDDRWEQLIRLKQENESLTSELDKLRDRIKMLQRREREVNLQLKEAKEESDRTKSKFLQSEALKNEGEVILSDRERTIKEQQTELKRLEEKIQDLNVQLSNQQKRVEFKQGSYQQQLRKLNEKYSQSESERQKITFDYNTLLAKLEETEKKHQAAAKEKDRNYAEEKNRLNKKIDSLSQNIDKLKEEQADRETQLNQANLQIKVQAKREAEREEKLANLESELELTKQQLRKELDQRKIYQKEISDYKLIEEERNQLRKRNNQLNSELSKTNQKLDRTASELANTDQKAKDLEYALAERNKEKDNLNNRLNSLKKEHDALKKEEERLVRQLDNLSAQSFNAGQKINDLKSKLQTQKNDAEEVKAYYEDQLAYLAKGKQYAEHEIEQLRWSLEKAQQQNQQLAQRLRTANNDILALNQTNLLTSEKAKRAEDETKELRSLTETLRKEIIDWEQKERQLNDQLKGKGQTAYEINKKLQKAQSQLFLVREKLRQTESSSQQRRSSDQKTLRQRQRNLSQKGQQLTISQLQNMSLKEQQASLTQELAIRINQINYLKDTLHSAKQDLANRDIKLEEAREELKLALSQNEQLSKDIEKAANSLEEEQKAATRTRREWEEYRNGTQKALQQLLEEIAKDEEGTTLTKQNLLNFPDQTLSAMQVETVKKRNAILSKYQLAVLQLNEEKALVENQLKKTRKTLAEREEEYESNLRAQKQRHRNSASLADSSRQQLQRKIQELQQQKLHLSGQIQKSANQIKKREDIIEQLRDELNAATAEIESLRGDLRVAEEKVLGLKSNEIKWKASNQSKISQLAGQNDSVLQRHKLNIAQLQKRILNQQKIAREKDQNIKKQQTRISQLSYEKQKSEVRVLELHQKWVVATEERKQLEKRIKLLEKDNKEANLILNNTKDSLNNEKAKLEEVQQKLNQSYATATEAQVQVQKYKAELQSVRSSVRQAETQVREKGERIKSTGEKWGQQSKQMKQKIISLTSTIQLKQFHIGQLEGQLASLRENLSETKQQLTKKKNENIKLADRIQQHKNQEMYNSQNIQILKSENQFLSEENDRLKERVTALEEEMTEAQLQIEAAELKEKEVIKLREEIQTLKIERQRATSDLRSSVGNPRNPNATSRTANTDERKRIRELEQLLQAKHVDLAIERKKLINDFERDKRSLIQENTELHEHVENLQNQFDFQRAQLSKEIDSLSEEIGRLTLDLAEKNQILATSERLLETCKNEENAQQIDECLYNIKTIFERSEAHQERLDLEHNDAGEPLE